MTEATATDTTTEATTEAAGTGTEQSNYTPPATQADLDRIIAERVARTKNQFKDYAELKAAKSELDQIREANKTDAQRKDDELARLQAETETWRTVAVGSRIEALAAVDFADPTDALAELSDKAKYLDTNGQIDAAAIQADLAAVLERKPHWRKGTETQSRLPFPNHAQGSGEKPPATTPDGVMNALIRSSRGGQ